MDKTKEAEELKKMIVDFAVKHRITVVVGVEYPSGTDDDGALTLMSNNYAVGRELDVIATASRLYGAMRAKADAMFDDAVRDGRKMGRGSRE